MSELSSDERQAIIDGEHLRVLAICHYVLGGVVAFFACFAIVYAVLGVAIALSPEFFKNEHRPQADVPPAFVGALLAGIGGTAVCLGWAVGGLEIFVGRSLHKRRRRTLTLVVAALNCLWIPFGTLLGVFTFIVLLRPSVIRLYEEAERAQAALPPR